MAKYQYVLVTCARWEETEIVEWLEYHKSVGFDHVYLYSNDDDPTALFRTVMPYVLGSNPYVTFLHWPNAGAQVKAFLHYLEHLKHETVWFSFLDIDEFLVFKGIDDVETFMQPYDRIADCLYFNWVCFGHSGKKERENVPTLTSYLRRARHADVHTKMLIRSAAIDAAAVREGSTSGSASFWHFLDDYKLGGVRCMDVLKHPMDGYSANFPESTRPFLARPGFTESILERAYIAHFQFKSEADFMRRWRRGGFPNVNHWRSLYESGRHQRVLESRNVVYDSYLASYWHRHTTGALCFPATESEAEPGLQNVALNKPSWQSSVYQDTTVNTLTHRMSGAGNNGIRPGGYGFHTQHDERPRWTVDLLASHRIGEIRIYNRRDPGTAYRANALQVLASVDGATWAVLFTRTAPETFGLDGAPLIVRTDADQGYRFVMVQLTGPGMLHLEEVEVYGTPWNGPGGNG